jgi:hypothetical protein
MDSRVVDAFVELVSVSAVLIPFWLLASLPWPRFACWMLRATLWFWSVTIAGISLLGLSVYWGFLGFVLGLVAGFGSQKVYKTRERAFQIVVGLLPMALLATIANDRGDLAVGLMVMATALLFLRILSEWLVKRTEQRGAHHAVGDTPVVNGGPAGTLEELYIRAAPEPASAGSVTGQSNSPAASRDGSEVRDPRQQQPAAFEVDDSRPAYMMRDFRPGDFAATPSGLSGIVVSVGVDTVEIVPLADASGPTSAGRARTSVWIPREGLQHVPMRQVVREKATGANDGDPATVFPRDGQSPATNSVPLFQGFSLGTYVGCPSCAKTVKVGDPRCVHCGADFGGAAGPFSKSMLATVPRTTVEPPAVWPLVQIGSSTGLPAKQPEITATIVEGLSGWRLVYSFVKVCVVFLVVLIVLVLVVAVISPSRSRETKISSATDAPPKQPEVTATTKVEDAPPMSTVARPSKPVNWNMMSADAQARWLCENDPQHCAQLPAAATESPAATTHVGKWPTFTADQIDGANTVMSNMRGLAKFDDNGKTLRVQFNPGVLELLSRERLHAVISAVANSDAVLHGPGRYLDFYDAIGEKIGFADPIKGIQLSR